NGNLVSEPTATATSSLTPFQFTGTYTVAADCTGILTFSQKSSSNSNAPVFTGTFLITNPLVLVNSNGVVAFQNTFQLKPSIVFSFTSQSQIISGVGKGQ